MRKKTKTRALSLLLALVMILGLSPGTARATGGTAADYFEGFPLVADPGTGTTQWTVSGGMLQSGNKGKANSSSTLKLTFTQDTHISFEYKVSCEKKYDYFTINGGSQESGNLDWQLFSKEVQNGEILTIVYKKDSSGDKYDDRVYLRNFSCGEGVTVTFHNGDETATQTVYGGAGTLKANPFVKDHAVFTGWATAEGGEVAYTDGARIEVTGALDLYAVWAAAYVVTFRDGTKTTTQNIIQGGKLDNLPVAAGKNGYTFDGWFHDETELTNETEIINDITYTAKYSPITYTIRFNANSGSGTMEDITAVYDQSTALPSCVFTREGYHFLGWNTSSYSSSATYKDGAEVKNLQNRQDAVQTLYAVWAGDAVPVTIDLNYDGSENTTRQCVVGENYNYISTENGKTFSTLADPKREGYNFKGWFTAAEGGEKITNQYKFKSTESVILYAHWAKAVTVTFDANGGTCYTKNKTIDKGSAYGSLPSASLSGKKFLGWFIAAEGGEQADNTTIFNEDTTLYAHFRNYQITVSFDANGGTGNMEPLICESGVATQLPVCAFTPPAGRRFARWTTIKNPSSWESPKYYDDGAEYSWSSSYNDSSATLYAVWEEGEPEQPDPPKPDTPSQELLDAVEALGQWYKLYPVFGTDTNAVSMVQADLAKKGYADVSVSVKEVTAINGLDDGTSGIADDGAITYFYADPNGMRGAWFGSYHVDFVLSKGSGSVTLSDVPVTVYWDVDKVKETMKTEILDHVTLDAEASADLSLPRVVDGRRWTQISWQSSDENIISISGKNQSTADTLFDPYVGVVKQGSESKTVTLTATFTFQRTNTMNGGAEKPITLDKVFTVTVPPMDGVQVEEIRQGLLAKLNAGFEKAGLTDAATGKKLTAENGVYTAFNDIQFPTTRDFGVDGKYYPVTITAGGGEILKAPDVNNAARVEVYRPGVGQPDGTGTITVTLRDKDTSVTVSREFTIRVPALTQTEIDAELALMEKVKTAYFDGIKGSNDTKNNVRTDLSPFFEVFEGEDGELVWVRVEADRAGRGIIPVPMEGWEELELWRLFRSSNPNVISHENLIVTRQTEAKAVTVTSRLSSETLGRYGELYLKFPERYPQYAGLEALYYQEVTTGPSAQPEGRRMARAAAQPAADTIVVRGTRDPDSTVTKVETLDNITFSLTGLDGEEWLSASYTGLDETSTVYDILTRALSEHGGYAVRNKGTYIASIKGPRGELKEKQYGDDSGWMYRVNGKIPRFYAGACFLRSGDAIQMFYTRDANKDDPNYSRPSGGSSGSSSGGSSPGGKTEQTNAPSVKKSDRADTYTVTLPKGGSGPQLVTIPDVKQGRLVVIVHADGREEVIKKSTLENGRAKFLLEQDAAVKVVDYVSPFTDVAGSAWYSSAVDFVSGRGLFAGVRQNSFAPNLPLTRGMLAAVLFRLEEPGAQGVKAPFADVADGSWYEQGTAWAAEAGIVSGYGNGRFGPNDKITREQLAVMLFRYARLLELNTGGRDSLTEFSDCGAVSPWAQDAVAWAVDSGIISGLPNGSLAPAGTATRAEAAAMLERFVNFMLK